MEFNMDTAGDGGWWDQRGERWS